VPRRSSSSSSFFFVFFLNKFLTFFLAAFIISRIDASVSIPSRSLSPSCASDTSAEMSNPTLSGTSGDGARRTATSGS